MISSEQRKQQSALKKMLTSEDHAQIDQAIEMLQSLNSVELFDSLTRSIKLNQYGTSFSSGAFKGLNGHYVMLKLIANAPKDSRLVQLASSLQALRLEGNDMVRIARRRIDLLDLLALPNLEKVLITRYTLIMNRPLLHPKLHTLRFDECQGMPAHLSELVEGKIRDLILTDNPGLRSLDGVQGLPLESLYIRGVRDLTPISNHPTLRHIEARGRVDYTPVITIPKLTSAWLDRTQVTPALQEALKAKGIDRA